MSLEKKALLIISVGLLVLSGCVGGGLQKETIPESKLDPKYLEKDLSLLKGNDNRKANRMLAWIELSRD